MTIKIIESNARGKADFGWPKANFSFSFGNYINPERFQFGMLRVLNENTIEMREKKRKQKRLLWVFPDKVNVNQRYD